MYFSKLALLELIIEFLKRETAHDDSYSNYACNLELLQKFVDFIMQADKVLDR